MLLRLILALMLLAPSALAQDPGQPVVRTSLNPKDGIVIGEPVQLSIDVMFPGEMPRPPLVTVGDAPGAQILRFETQATTMRDRIGDQDYVGQRFEFTVFPRRGGTIDIPAAEVTLRDRNGDQIGTLKAEPARFAVTVPPGIDPSGPVLAAPNVKVSQSWSRDPGSTTFKVGDVVTRVIRRQAADVPALGMAEFHFTAPDGVGVYPDTPVIDDKIFRGSVEGVRTDKVTYVFEKPGTYALPDLSQPWWNMVTRQARSETLAGASVSVDPALPSRPAGRNDARQSSRGLVLILSGGLLLLGLALLRPRMLAAWQALRKRYLGSEAHAGKALREIARTGEAAATYREFKTWLDRLPAGAAREIRSDPRLQSLIDELERHLFGRAGNWSRQKGTELAAIALNVRAATRAQREPVPPALPPLNPRSP